LARSRRPPAVDERSGHRASGSGRRSVEQAVQSAKTPLVSATARAQGCPVRRQRGQGRGRFGQVSSGRMDRSTVALCRHTLNVLTCRRCRDVRRACEAPCGDWRWSLWTTFPDAPEGCSTGSPAHARSRSRDGAMSARDDCIIGVDKGDDDRFTLRKIRRIISYCNLEVKQKAGGRRRRRRHAPRAYAWRPSRADVAAAQPAGRIG
jgi:hypothetical protein